MNVSVDAETQTEIYNNVAFNTVQFSDDNGSIRQVNEIKYLRKELAETKKQNNKLTLKLKREKLLKLKLEEHVKAHKILKRRYATMLKKVEEIPILKEFGSGLITRRANWSPQCLKLAMQLRYNSN